MGKKIVKNTWRARSKEIHGGETRFYATMFLEGSRSRLLKSGVPITCGGVPRTPAKYLHGARTVRWDMCRCPEQSFWLSLHPVTTESSVETSQGSGILGLLTVLTFYPIEVQFRITDNK